MDKSSSIKSSLLVATPYVGRSKTGRRGHENSCPKRPRPPVSTPLTLGSTPSIILVPLRLLAGPYTPFPLPPWQDNWYDENYFCSQTVDDTAVFPEIGGCKYDYPMGDCMDIDVDVSDTVRGCALALETHVTDKVRGCSQKKLVGLSCRITSARACLGFFVPRICSEYISMVVFSFSASEV